MQVYSVRQVATHLRELVESDLFLSDLWIAGEVSNLRRYPSGHLYFSLKEADAALSCVLFKSANTGFQFEDGNAVVAHGHISFYEVRGDLQFIVDFVQPEGVGALQAEFERLKARLQEEGLFDEARKRPLPRFPGRIGVATSPAGAVFHDICHVLERRWPLAEVVLAPTAVQGPEAVPGLVAALDALNREPGIDVIIVARGGGSLEDLWAFNAEAVARAVFGSRVPVVSGVGHETDTTICDYVADVRAPTPSAAAELVAPDRTEVSVRLSVAAGTLRSHIQSLADEGRGHVALAVGRVERAAPEVNRERQRTDELTRTAQAAVEGLLRGFQKGLHGFQLALRSLDPYATLQRGYALVQRNGHVVESVADTTVGERLDVRVRDGDFPVRVDSERPVPDRARRRRTKVAQEQAALFHLEV
ncbi:MAG: exodeoxyribonuclease VII large subunit [Chloroflexi bacterium RBG_16_68_14]|nr:MAG: exodeoxyribonuclease VII large subunit [Chloroflexi bacterium RBG_16_68_14]